MFGIELLIFARAFGYAIDIQDDILVISEAWAEVEEHGNCGRLHVFKLGALVTSQEQVEETTTEQMNLKQKPMEGFRVIRSGLSE